ncbi:MAG: AAA family ATPase [Verrucomicrobiales bacterium]|nr:AAA family ATPase [Verrucomicrobiales bacterium]
MPALPTYHGRDEAQRQFGELWSKPKASLVVLQGRRRIGKSAFAAQCAKTQAQHFLRFEGLAPRDEQGREDQLAAFAEQLHAQTALPRLKLESWPQAFQLLANALPASGRTVLLLDEISWMGCGDRDFAGHLKVAWDNWFSTRRNLVVVLCGSVSSWIQENILNNTGFVGRCSLTFSLAPLRLPECVKFWGKKAERMGTMEKIRLLSVTGGVPRYLEEINPAQTAEQNLHRLCFQPEALLFREFDAIFSAIFDRRAGYYRGICEALAGPAKTVLELSKALGVERGGALTAALEDLVQSGFLQRDQAFDPASGRTLRQIKFRLSDNYLRFYLRYIEPAKRRIERGLFKKLALDALPAWDGVMGLQFENLVLQNLDALQRELGLETTPILNAAPYFQNKTQRQEACQIDLLLRTRQAVYVLEMKLRQVVPKSTITEVKEKVRRLKLPRGQSYRTVLVYAGELESGLAEEDYFDCLVPFESLLRDF